jgi:hypothetical protein
VYTFTLTNLGNVTDTFELEVSGAWTATLSAGDTGALGVGESVVVTVTVMIPAGAGLGDDEVVTLTATSVLDAEVSRAAVITTRVASWVIHLPVIFRPYFPSALAEPKCKPAWREAILARPNLYSRAI